MKTHNLLTIIACATIAIMQTAYIFMSARFLRLHGLALQPLIYVTLAVACIIFLGKDERPVRKAYYANMVAILSAGIFGIVFFVSAIVFGAGANAMAGSPAAMINTLWTHGSVVILGTVIRYKLIRKAMNPVPVTIAITIVLAYGQMNGLRMLFAGVMDFETVFFESTFALIAMSSIASFFALRGSFTSVLLISSIYILTPYFVPILPHVTPVVWALIRTGPAFLTAVIYNFITNDKSRHSRALAKREARYTKKPVWRYSISLAVIGLAAAFFVGAFPIYPVVIITSSMEPTMSRGSVVFVERVPQGEALIRVGEGYVIHFLGRGGVEYIHRVADFRFDVQGNRQYVTQGDANDRIDPLPVPQDNVLGIARAVLPHLGHPILFFRELLRSF